MIAGTYTVERLIGQGGMGAVFLASHARLPGKQVAIKVLHAELADPESLARFRREAEIATRLGHANIVEVHDFNVLPDGTPYLVLEYLQGESLAQRIAAGPLPLEQTMTIVRQIGSALAAAHREDIIHRDLKPQNVFLVPVDADGFATERAKVLDFGISKIRGSQTIKTQDTSILGTPQYMAPEQALGNNAAVDARTDVFALGAMVYEMLCGKPAFSGASVPEVVFKVVYEEPQPIGERVPGLPAPVAAAVTRALSKKADDRFPDVGSFVEALTGQPVTTGKRPLVVPTPPAGDAPPGSEKISSREAFAQTMGSGDHAQSLGIEATVASGRHEPATPAATVAPDAAPAPAPARRGGAGTIIAIVAILAAAGVAIAYFAMKGGGDAAAPAAAAAPDATVVAEVSVDAAAAAPPAAAVDAAAEVAAAPVDAAPKKPRPDAAPPKPPAPPQPPEEVGDDEEAPAGIRACTALLDDDPDEAMRCANKILEQRPGTPAAHAVRGKAYCANGDQEKALGVIRRLNRNKKLRRQVIAYCARQGLQLQ